MKVNFLKIGKIVGVHGIKGFVRVQYWCDSAQFFCQFSRFFTDENETNVLYKDSASAHGNVALLKIKGIDTPEAANSLRGTVLYIARQDAKLPKGKYFLEELIGCSVIDNATEKVLGKLSEVSQTGANDVWHISDGEKEYLFPAVKEFIEEIDIDTAVIKIKPPKGIFDDEN